MKIPTDVEEILVHLIESVRTVLAGNLTAMYLRGSLATADFIPETSDIDLLVATHLPISETEFTLLAHLHERVAQFSNPYANRIEIAYLDRKSLRRYEAGMRHPTLGQGETLTRSEHGANWILERWTVREEGIVLLGPDPRTLIDPISSKDLRNAAAARFRDWADWMSEPDGPDWLLWPGQPKYVVDTMCRAMYTIAFGQLSSKRIAVTWALGTLSEPWRSIVENSLTWKDGNSVDSASLASEAKRFVLWAAGEGQVVVSGSSI